jgi:uncharacterized protein YggU (UPF0235/DUF167 family)
MYIKVEVNTKAKKDKIEQKGEDRFEVWIKEKPERNLANQKVKEMLALYFDILPSKVRIINGHHKSHKLLNITK